MPTAHPTERIIIIKTHNSESQGQEEAAATE